VRRKKYAIATLFFGNRVIYKTMAKILFDSLRRYGFYGQADPILLTTEDVDPVEFARWDVQVIKIKERKYPERYNGPCPRMFNKFEAFNLVEYEKVLMIDADAYAVDKDPLLFEMPTPTFLIEQHVPLAAGSMIIKPSKGVYEDLVKLAQEGEYNPATGWNNCGPAPEWPKWHKAMFWRKYIETLAPLVQLHTWNFLYAASEQGLLYYYFNYCQPGYVCYHFPAFFQLAGDCRAEVLLQDRDQDYWRAAAEAGLKDELEKACRADTKLRWGKLP
jgi:hypothetical protein